MGLATAAAATVPPCLVFTVADIAAAVDDVIENVDQ